MRILGIDIGGTRLKAGLVDDSGNLSDSISIKTPADAAEFEQAMRAFVTARPADGVGIGCKGIINAASTRVEVLPGMLHFLEGRLLSEFVDLPVPVRADN